MNKSLYQHLLDRFKSQNQGDLILANLHNSQSVKLSREEIQKIINDNSTLYSNIIKNLQPINDIKMSSEERDRKILELDEFKRHIEYIKNNPEPINNFKYNFFSKENERLRVLNLQADERWIYLNKRGKESLTDTNTLNSYENYKDVNRNTLSKVYELNITNKKGGGEISTGMNNSNWKPFGEIGDITLNQFLNKGSFIISPIYNFFNNYYYELLGVTSFLTSFFMYKKVVSWYSNFTEPLDDLKHTISKEYRVKNIKSFMLFGAPFVVFGLIGLSRMFFNNSIRVEKNSSGVIEHISRSSETSLFLLLGGVIKRVPSWLRVLIITFITFYIIRYFFPGYANNNKFSLFYITDLMVFYSYYVRIIFKIGIIINTFFIIKYSLTIYFYIMFSKGRLEMEIPIHLPKTTLNWLNYIKIAIIYEKDINFIELHIRYILVYIVTIYLYIFIINIYS